MNTPIAILCSDLHLSLTAPVARSAEPDWLAAQKRQLDQLRALHRELRVPVICAGDILDHWRSPPELLNFAIENLPHGMLAIPGQHDLPLHNYGDIRKSGYHTLCQAGVIENLHPGTPVPLPGSRVLVWGFPWGFPVKPVGKSRDLNLAVVHAFIWQSKETAYPGAPEEATVSARSKSLAGYNAAVFGDNHKPFLTHKNGCVVFNHGGFQRRRSDERNHRPSLGLLMDDLTVELHPLDCSQDLWIDQEKARLEEGEEFNARSLMKELKKLSQDDEISFRNAMHRYLQVYQVSPGAQRIILEAMDQEVAK